MYMLRWCCPMSARRIRPAHRCLVHHRLVPCHGVLDGEIEGGWWEMTLQRQQAQEEHSTY